MTRPPLMAADHIRELTHGFTTTERIDRLEHGRVGKVELHHVTHPGLIDQLHTAITMTSSKSDDDAGTHTFTSKPSARIDAIDTLARIDRESHDYATDLGLEPARRTRTKVATLTVTQRLLAISGKVGDRPDSKVKAWWVAARIATQWEAPAFHPKGAPCPVPECEQFGTLRVRLEDLIATCTACGSFWDGRSGVENLGRYVRWSTDHDLSKPRHDVLAGDALVPCLECAATRDAMGERAAARAVAAVAGRGVA